MHGRFIEATQAGPNGEGGALANHGKFYVGRFDGIDWRWPSFVTDGEPPARSLLAATGWGREHILVLDVQTGEGAMFRHGGHAKADLDKHRVWVCPMFEPFLTWLYTQDLTDLTALPEVIQLPDAPFAVSGYRRAGEDIISTEEIIEATRVFATYIATNVEGEGSDAAREWLAEHPEELHEQQTTVTIP
jgi:hypothetical protein